METRGKYKTRQRELVASCLAANDGRYLSVDDVLACVSALGQRIGRTTVYRNLETLVGEGAVMKVVNPGGEARYRLTPDDEAGQLVCLSCGEALPLDCGMLRDFSQHVREHHGFRVENTQTVLYGLCGRCAEYADE